MIFFPHSYQSSKRHCLILLEKIFKWGQPLYLGIWDILIGQLWFIQFWANNKRPYKCYPAVFAKWIISLVSLVGLPHTSRTFNTVMIIKLFLNNNFKELTRNVSFNAFLSRKIHSREFAFNNNNKQSMSSIHYNNLFLITIH